MTNGEKMQEVFPEGKTRKCRGGVVFESDGWCHAYGSDWWNAEYKEPITERVQKINKSAMMQEIYMEGVNMGGEYQGCWVRFKEIEKIVDRYVR